VSENNGCPKTWGNYGNMYAIVSNYLVAKFYPNLFLILTHYIDHGHHLRVTPPFWYAVFRGNLDGTQYAKGRYAVRRNSVISYADINFYFKKVQFLSKNTTRMTYKVK